MANYVIQDITLTNIANAIREKSGSEDAYKPTEMAAAISAITTGGGSSEIKVRTPEEIYTEDRPADWPVLPDPVEDNEIYYLCETMWDGTSKYFVFPQCSVTHDVEWGYINENGEFVVTQRSTDVKGVYWGRYGASKETETDKYHVVRTTKGDTTQDAPTSSNKSSDKMPYVREIKARGKNFKFGTGKNDYYVGFTNCSFITLYGPQDWNADSSYKFYGLSKLKCLRFDSDEHNIFLQPNSKITSLSRLFSSCYCLEYAYPINNFTKLTDVSFIYGYCYNLRKADIENDVVTTTNGVLQDCKGLVECSIKIPKGTSAAIHYSSPGRTRKFTNLDISGATSTSYMQYIIGYGCEEMLNVKINNSLDYSSYGPAYYNSYGSQQLRRFTMVPDQESMPASFKVMLYTADKDNIKEFFESLPTITTTCALTIYNYMLYSTPDEEILSIATNKGYTVSITK